jgi:aryl-alcohol dehydrogenase-like predicted oxidoreductase
MRIGKCRPAPFSGSQSAAFHTAVKSPYAALMNSSLPKRTLGHTGLELPILSFGASSLGAEFRSVTLDEVFASVHTALECGMTFIDTSPFYGRGMSEVLLGLALRGVPRDRYTICTKLGRYDLAHFDFSARRVAESVDVSLHRLGCGYLDIVLCHDIEFVPMQQIVDETLPALRKAREQGKVRFVGFSGYPMKIFRFILDQTPVDCVLSYNQYTLQNTRFADEIVPYLKARGVGAMNAGPFSARLLTNAPLPPWLKEPEEVKAAARKAAAHCSGRGMDIAKLALQFSIRNPDITTTIAGSANPNNIRNWAKWASEPVDENLLRDVQAIFSPVKNIGHTEGLPENN